MAKALRSAIVALFLNVMKRRTLLQATGAVAAASTLGAFSPSPSKAASRNAQFQTGEPPVGFRPLQTESNDLTPYTGAWTDDTLRHLLRRSMFGVPPAQFDASKALGGMNKVIDKLLEASDITKVALPKPPGDWVFGLPDQVKLNDSKTYPDY